MCLTPEVQNELRKRYNPDGSNLRIRQLKLMEILDIVDEICKEEDIPYWLSSGTLLGAVRHGGFIPWDDDIDVDIRYSDLPRFVSACKHRLPDGYVLQNHDTDGKYINNIVKIRETSSCVCEKTKVLGKEYVAEYTYNGLFIDILPVEPSFRIFIRFSRIFMSILSVAKYRLSLNDKIVHVLYLFTELMYSFFRFMSRVFKAPKNYVSYGCYFIGERIIEEILPTGKIMFEGKTYSAPKNYHAYLTRMYGDYSKLPSETTRKPTHE